MEAALWKKGKNKKAFLKRTFLLCQREFTLRYFVREDVGTFYEPFDGYLAELQSQEYCASLTPCPPPPLSPRFPNV